MRRVDLNLVPMQSGGYIRVKWKQIKTHNTGSQILGWFDNTNFNFLKTYIHTAYV
jgi:hypothetical protein